MVLTDSEMLNDKMRRLRDHGTDSRCPHYYHPVLGYNYRMTNLQAAILEPQIKQLPFIMKCKKQIFEWYDEFLGEEATPPEYYAESTPGYWLYSACFEDRDEIIKKLKLKDIESRPFFKPTHTMPYIWANKESFPVSVYISQSGINFPSYISLTKEDVEFICSCV